jgi:hypothetical protein
MNALRQATVEDLREFCRKTTRPEREKYEFSLLPGGVPRGVLIELAGLGKTEVIVQFLRENPKLRVAWIEESLTIYPCAVAQRNVALSRLLFIEASSEIFWATFQVLRSNLFDCVVISSKRILDEKNLRRMQLESEKGNSGIFLLTEELHKAWPIALQLKVSRGLGGEVKLNVMRERT